MRFKLSLTEGNGFHFRDLEDLDFKIGKFIYTTLKDISLRVVNEERRSFYYSLIDEGITEDTESNIREYWKNKILSTFRNLDYIIESSYSGSRRYLTFKIEF